MSLESISSVSSADNTTSSQEYPKLLVDKELFQSIEKTSSAPKAIKRRSKSGMRKLKCEMQNQSNIKEALKISEESIKINAQNFFLHEAAEQGDLSAAEDWLSRGFDPNQQDLEGKVALHIAAKHGNIKFMELLLKWGGDINIVDMNYQSAFHYAIDSNQPDVIFFLSQNIDRLDVLNNPSRHVNLITPLAKACIQNKRNMITALLDCGAKPDVVFDYDSSEWNGAFGFQRLTAVHFAAASCDPEIVQLLIDRGPDFEYYDNYPFWPPISSAAESGNFDVFKYLFDRKSSYNDYVLQKILYDCYSNPKENEFHDIKVEKKLKCLTYLLDSGIIRADLIYFITSGYVEAVKLFVDRGYFTNFDQLLGAFVNGSSKNDFRIFEFLVERGANIFIKTDCGSSLLHIASQSYRPYGIHFVKFLVEHGLDVNEKDFYGRTLLDCEGYITNPEILNYLISVGAKYGKDVKSEKIH